MRERIRINHQIRAAELRVLDAEGTNLGVLKLSEALTRAHDAGLDLIEISPNANPPVARIMDHGKFEYDRSKKRKEARANTKIAEVKSIQIKLATGEHDLELKAKKVSDWLKEGHRVKIELYLIGRSKYLEFNFLKQRLERIMRLISVEYKVTDEPKKGPKGLTVLIDRAK